MTQYKGFNIPFDNKKNKERRSYYQMICLIDIISVLSKVELTQNIIDHWAEMTLEQRSKLLRHWNSLNLKYRKEE